MLPFLSLFDVLKVGGGTLESLFTFLLLFDVLKVVGGGETIESLFIFSNVYPTSCSVLTCPRISHFRAVNVHKVCKFFC